MTAIKNFGIKAYDLRAIVAEAAEETRKPRALPETPFSSSFDGFRPSPPLDRLTDLLRTTDALYVLDELLNGGEE